VDSIEGETSSSRSAIGSRSAAGGNQGFAQSQSRRAAAITWSS
jgi:hypothetical protein